jgi:hypothetical protein
MALCSYAHRTDTNRLRQEIWLPEHRLIVISELLMPINLVSLDDESPRLTEEIVESKLMFSLYNVLRNVDLLSFFFPC